VANLPNYNTLFDSEAKIRKRINARRALLGEPYADALADSVMKLLRE
jgi:hypothetical protein